jgi:hypothetical protein
MTTPGIVETVRVGTQGPAGPGAVKVYWSGTSWPSRPTSAGTAPVFWLGGTTEPAGAIDGDVWITA